jgi:hypothetical protein
MIKLKKYNFNYTEGFQTKKIAIKKLKIKK